MNYFSRKYAGLSYAVNYLRTKNKTDIDNSVKQSVTHNLKKIQSSPKLRLLKVQLRELPQQQPWSQDH